MSNYQIKPINWSTISALYPDLGSKRLTFPMAKRPLSKRRMTPRKRKVTPNPAKPTPISGKRSLNKYSNAILDWVWSKIIKSKDSKVDY